MRILQRIKWNYRELFWFFNYRLRRKFLISTLVFVLISLCIPVVMKHLSNTDLYHQVASIATPVSGKANEALKEMLGYDWMGLWIHNVVAALLSIIGGVIPFIYVGFIALIENAFVLGYQVGVTESMMNYDLSLLWVVSVFPHGVLEYFIHILVYTFSISFCSVSTRWYLRRDNLLDAKLYHVMAVKGLIFIVIPGLFICSLLEFYVTPFLIWKFLLH